MKKVMIAGIGAVMLLGGVYGMKSVSAAANPQKVETKVVTQTNSHVGKRMAFRAQYTDQIHQMKKLRAERLDLKKQWVEKKDQLMDYVLAAKQNREKDKLKQVRDVKKQLKAIHSDIKPLMKDARAERKELKAAVRKGDAKAQFAKLISTQQQINEKMKAEVAELNKMIDILN
ncbi:hypothetical protein IEC97_10705 [Neobacillus cucumis]|uniref:hypothetical protein n=1 Tax=Neobacillus cucumis TaxID=1740721 RepID=UPI0018DF401B|nr:hypothetical protein [Neobacillus cucumis]MBI0577834.1 hypothetical protein [Neobacillus cucumis]